ncbi:hypothetical protein GcC1_204009 [Golovinomyces cichoracearum]|uniref:Cytoskeleton-associated protein n=1 Tax=Golovinomyces cichoracearum TaxID=62708 RepID=A0A420HD55_9PEZI|nr:hypothetical protein GcC1_204009 [Golovinomyces cichoracearum]
MTGPSPSSYDTFVVGFGVLMSCAVFITMRQMLTQFRNAAVIPLSENKPQYISQDIKDLLKLSTLEKLLDSPSCVIRETTNIIICERALHDQAALSIILDCIKRPDYETREKGVRVFNLLINNILTVGTVQISKIYCALVSCLEHCTTDYEHNSFDLVWDNWYFRDVVEQQALGMLILLVEKFGAKYLIRYRFIDRWLVKEPWGNTIDERQINFAKLILASDQKLNDLVSPILHNSTGVVQLKEVQLVTDVFPTNLKYATEIQGYRLHDYTDTFFIDLAQRNSRISSDEYRRRRNREAMVLNDGLRPLGRADIIHRER